MEEKKLYEINKNFYVCLKKLDFLIYEPCNIYNKKDMINHMKNNIKRYKNYVMLKVYKMDLLNTDENRYTKENIYDIEEEVKSLKNKELFMTKTLDTNYTNVILAKHFENILAHQFSSMYVHVVKDKYSNEFKEHDGSMSICNIEKSIEHYTERLNKRIFTTIIDVENSIEQILKTIIDKNYFETFKNNKYYKELNIKLIRMSMEIGVEKVYKIYSEIIAEEELKILLDLI